MRKAALLTVVAVIALLLTGGSLLAGGNGSQNGNGPGGGNGPAASCSLDQTEIDDLMHMREEEKLDRDVYLDLYDFYNDFGYNASIFSNIAESERNHMDTLGDIIAKYYDQCKDDGLFDPIDDPESRGDFVNEELGNLYEYLVGVGELSFGEALRVGATIEDLDIADLIHALEHANNKDLQTAYLNLTKGSRNHLRAFVPAYKAETGLDYLPDYICEELFLIIVGSETENVNYSVDDMEYLLATYPPCVQVHEEDME